MRKTERLCISIGLSFLFISIILLIIGVNIMFCVMLILISVVFFESVFILRKEILEVEALSKILQTLILSSGKDKEVQLKRDTLISQTNILERLIYRIEFGRRLK